MRKHRVLAGLLAAVMLLGTMPAAAEAVESASGIKLNKTATQLNSNWETDVTLTVTAPAAAAEKPIAVEFVLDGTESMFKTAGKMTTIKAWGDAIQEQLRGKNIYVGVTVFGSEAKVIQNLEVLDTPLDLERGEDIEWLTKSCARNGYAQKIRCC